MPSSSASTEGRLNLARSSSSLPPGKLLILQTSASFSGACVAVPEDARTAGLVASRGSGSAISTPCADDRSLNCDFALTRYSVLDLLTLLTRSSTVMSGLTC